MRVITSILFSIAFLSGFAQVQDTLKPVIRLRYMNKPFDSNLIKEGKFYAGRFLPIEISLEKQGETLKDESYVMTEVVIMFVYDKIIAHRKVTYKGHPVFLDIRWPEEYTWESGSSLIIKAKYNHWLNSVEIGSGLVEEIIEF